ncbi:flavo protein monooxygenase [Lentithecium fluviatile CBS 122367]|uniref:Flavo protein monooxygenase n=1 Tax=Lentithecium fluviatile CBS 122367 TaxID=1168545 RepID=A0A6G1ICQ6_9PLEO|nr:flavo protein monooxygenase [Lentithecium fluviatile CBS 122367]
MSNLHILISGGGIAGPCLAWWLTKAQVPAHITIVERSPTPRTTGQAVDIRDFAVDVIRGMGLEETIRSKTTTEEGIEFVYADGVRKAKFPASGDADAQSFTSEFEILRGDLAKIFYEVAKDVKEVEYIFGEHITEVQEESSNGKVRVRFANGRPEGQYDIVVGADGMISKTRQLVFGKGPDDGNYLKRLGQYVAFFTIPKMPSDTKFAQWYFTHGGRMGVTRPSQYGDTRAYLGVSDKNLSRFDGIARAMKEGKEAQMAWLAEQMQGAGWQMERLVEGMKSSEDFYMQETAQVKIESFVKGRVALLGDAGYCPSPISGVGTTSAIVGAYVLAGEISNSPDNIPQALVQYHNVLRPFVNQCQTLPPGAPHIANPQTELGVKIVDTMVGIASSLLVKKIASVVSGALPRAFTSRKWEAPKYAAFEG